MLHVDSSPSLGGKIRCNCSYTTKRKRSSVRKEEGIQYWIFMWQGDMVTALKTRKETLEGFDDLDRHSVLL